MKDKFIIKEVDPFVFLIKEQNPSVFLIKEQNPSIFVIKQTEDFVSSLPILVSAILSNANTCVLTFNKLLANIIPDNIDFVCTYSGGIMNVSGRSISGMTVILTLDAYAQNGQTLSIAYIPGANPIQDLDGNEAEAFTISIDVSVLVTPPVFSSIEVGTISNYSWNIVLDKAIANTMPAASCFAVTGFTFARDRKSVV